MIRQVIKKGDPLLKLELPQSLMTRLQEQAQNNKRKIQDEIIKRLCASLNDETVLTTYGFEISQTLANETETIQFAQIIPSELKEALDQLCQNSSLDLNQTVSIYLTATINKPESFGLNTTSEHILKHTFSQDMAIKECKRHRQNWLYIYEHEKLKLYLRFKKQLPRHTKETFMLLDTRSESTAILAEFQSECQID